MRQRNWTSILGFAAISAAFIGPGTVTTAAMAGSKFGLELLWAITFSVIACFVLQEASARVTIATQKDLGGALKDLFPKIIPVTIVLAVMFGCAAYEAGNILGGVAGAQLVTSIEGKLLTLIIGALAALVLGFGGQKIIGLGLAGIVAVMGIAFVYCAFGVPLGGAKSITSAVMPRFPEGSSTLLLGLIGTTVVPYNLFLGSGLAKGQSLADSRLGLAISIGGGGLISAAIMAVGLSLHGSFSFAGLAESLSDLGGEHLGKFFGFALFAAGLSSAITAPLAAGMAARSVFHWDAKGYKTIWITLGFGLVTGLLGFKAPPIIILAQALNGLLLPLVAWSLFAVARNRDLMGPYVSSANWQLILGFGCVVSTFLGTRALFLAFSKAFGFSHIPLSVLVVASLVVSAIAIWFCIRAKLRGI